MKAKKVFEQIFRHPAPMRRLDDYLLKNYPQVWRLRVHYVLVYWSLAAIVLFIAGYLMPMDYHNYIGVNERFKDFQILGSLIMTLFILLFFINWRKKVSRIQQKIVYRWYVPLIEILLYGLCFFAYGIVFYTFQMGQELRRQKFSSQTKDIFNSYLSEANDSAFSDTSTLFISVFSTAISAILFFFYCNTSQFVIRRSLTVSTIFAFIFGLLFRFDYTTKAFTLFFICVAFAAIVLLSVFQYRMASMALVSLSLIHTGSTLYLFFNPAETFEIPADHFVYHNYKWYFLSYWCLLLITLAILYRRHLTLPEKL